ncbi:MAG: 2-polyprenylphenol 6-hydroxylase [Alphaproteobacteria bacterium]|nr:2-polyprenylphenol 6-hydroxylase [Alphaproteobacteria bacterium]
MLASLRHIVRLIRLARILARHGTLDLLGLVGLGALAKALRPILPKPAPAIATLRRGQRIAAALQEMGPAFIKFGQTWSTRADLVGEEVAEDLAMLRDRLPPFPVEETRRAIEQAFSRPVADLFQSIDAVPVAAASIAQVHFAVTSDGREVAIKVLRPAIEQAFRRDIALFAWLARLAERTQPGMRRLRPVDVVKRFSDGTEREMDLTLEAAAASELADNFRDDPLYLVPAVDWSRTATRVLTLERVHGLNIADRPGLIAAGIDLEALVTNLLRVFLLQVFRDGFFHGDMHPGNLLVRDDGALVAVDFGIMGRLDLPSRRYLAELMLAFLRRDYVRAAEIHFEAGYVPADQSLAAFAQACRAMGEPVLGRPANEISIARFLAQLLRTTERFKMETQPQLLLLQKTMVVVEGVARSIEPSVVFWEKAEPVIAEWIRDNLGPVRQAADGARRALAALRRLPGLVDEAEGLLAESRRNGLRLHPETVQALSSQRRPYRSIEVVLAMIAGAALLALGYCAGG